MEERFNIGFSIMAEKLFQFLELLCLCRGTDFVFYVRLSKRFSDMDVRYVWRINCFVLGQTANIVFLIGSFWNADAFPLTDILQFDHITP
ncbi:hypothetical protein DU500_14010 [Haloplanus rubicundus]|uniref:Uncharacterized protein n=1 Tax=Haloplanus rubicundus TaxID=1547898 RepID=A0A345E5H7_9EURY|nr:hypothetical protein DU500_14010 [Haloplanus rubicundus]